MTSYLAESGKTTEYVKYMPVDDANLMAITYDSDDRFSRLIHSLHSEPSGMARGRNSDRYNGMVNLTEYALFFIPSANDLFCIADLKFEEEILHVIICLSSDIIAMSEIFMRSNSCMRNS